MGARNFSTGYMAIKKESSPGTAVTPNVYVPCYSHSMSTNFNVIEDEPVVGTNWGRYQTLRGIRSHTGTITVMAEPNTIGYILDAFTTKASTSGSDPYTHTFSASTSTAPNSYTIDISFGNQVIRWFGCQISKIQFGWDGEKMVLTLDVSALGCFNGREISNISTTTVDLKTEYDSSPTTGLVGSDLVQVHKIDGTSNLSTTISSITDGDTVVLADSAASYAAGDMLRLRPASPSFSLTTPFTWPKTQFFFAADASTADTNSATASNQTRLDVGSEISLMYPFENENGEARSGAYDPAALLRTVYDGEFKVKTFFDNADQVKYWNSLTKRAVVMVAYAGATNQYQLKITLNHIKPRTVDTPAESKATVYHEIDYTINYDTSDSKAFSVVVVNAVSTI